MVLRREAVEERLKELETIVAELRRYRDVAPEALADLSQRWIIERGLIAAAAMILDVADHILAGHFSSYSQTYEQALQQLHERGVLSDSTYEQIKGLGGLRNVLVHAYASIDPVRVHEHFEKGLHVFPAFANEVLTWLDDVSSPPAAAG